jgi:ribonuclease VapC
VTRLVVDTSAVVAVLLRERGHDQLLDAFDRADELLLSAPTYVELSIVMEARKGPAGTVVVDQLVRDAELELVPFDRELAARATEGWRRFGKGRHRAALNLGDCFTYALAVERGAAVLCVGDDFSETDVGVVRPTTSH